MSEFSHFLVRALFCTMLTMVAIGPACANDEDVTGTITAQNPSDKPSDSAVISASRAKLPAVATDLRLIAEPQRTRIAIDLTRGIEMRAFALSAPWRIIIDSEEVNFQFKPGLGKEGRGLVSALRYGLFAPGKSRMVLDLTGPVIIERARVEEAKDQQPPRLILELLATDEAGFLKNRAEISSNLARRSDREPVNKTIPRIQDRAPGPPVIVIDAGHGGPDSGAVTSGGLQEKELVLNFALALREKLRKRGHYQIVMTREDDRFIGLPERVRIARENRGAMFVSIHADSIRGADDSARGATIYTLSDTASDAEAAKLADRENKSDAIAGVDLSDEPSDVADILIDLTQRETRAFSLFFARSVAQELKDTAHLHRQPLRSAGFRVLRAHDVPSILLELGYLSSPQDLKFLTSPDWRDKTTERIARAIDIFFQRRQMAGEGKKSP